MVSRRLKEPLYVIYPSEEVERGGLDPVRAKPRSVADEVVLLRDLCDTMKHGSLCALGGFTPYPVMSARTHFPEDFGRPSKARLEAAE